MFYEAYYPDVRDATDQQKLDYVDRNAVMERSFQVPFAERFAYSAGNANRPVLATNGSLVVMDNERAPSNEQREGAIRSRHDYDIANKVAPFHDERRRTITDNNGDPQNANIESISKFVRRAISRDLENWNALENYLERAANQIDMLQPGMYSEEIRGSEEGFRADRRSYDLSKQSDSNVLDKSETRDADRRPNYLEKIVSENAMINTMSDAQVANASPVISDFLPAENIFQPRPQVIRYTFFKKPTTRLEDKTTIDTTPRNYGDNLIREEIADSREKQKENVKVTSIEISELPRHKTRHHHGEWPKRDYSTHRHRLESADRPIV